MVLRVLALIVCLAAAGWHLVQQQQSGRFQRIDELFLDFLVANARAELLKPQPGAPDEVVWLRMREEDAAEFAAWPPPPIDWHTLIKGLHAHQPEVVLIADPLNWGQPPPDFVPALADALLPLPVVVMAVAAEAAGADPKGPVFMGGLESALPRFQRIEGPAGAVPAIASLIAAPDEALRRHGQLGVVCIRPHGDGVWGLPYAMRDDSGGLVPSALAQTMAAFSRTPYAGHRLRLGAGAGALLHGGLFVPLNSAAEVAAGAGSPRPVALNALDLMAGTLAGGISAEAQAALAGARVVVIGIDHDQSTAPPSSARLHAEALAHLLALPRIRLLSDWQQRAIWGAAAIAALYIGGAVPRRRALWTGAAAIFAALVFGFIAFQSQRLWCPPTVPLALLLIAAVFGRLFGRSRKVEAEAPAAQS